MWAVVSVTKHKDFEEKREDNNFLNKTALFTALF